MTLVQEIERLRAAPADAYDISAAYYDITMSSPNNNIAPQVSFFASLARDGDHVLDVGAGTGRIAVKIAARATICCLEPSRAMRAILLSKVAQDPVTKSRITVLPSAAADFDLPWSFDYVVIAGVLHSLPPGERERLFATAARHMRPGALLAMDMVGNSNYQPTPPTLIGEATLGEIRYTIHAEIGAVSDEAAEVEYCYRSYLGDELVTEEQQTRTYYHLDQAAVVGQLLKTGFILDDPPPSIGVPAPQDALVARLPSSLRG